MTGADIAREAEAWIGTPFRHGAGVRGQGVDCGHLVLRVYQAVGIVPQDVVVPPYPPAWACHRGDRRFDAWFATYLEPVTEILPGDVLGFRVGRALIGHVGIATGALTVVHAHPDRGVVRDTLAAGDLSLRGVHREERRWFAGAWRARLLAQVAA